MTSVQLVVLVFHVGLTCTAWMMAFDTSDHEGPAGPGRAKPRLWFFLCMVWELVIVYCIACEIFIGVYKILIRNRLD